MNKIPFALGLAAQVAVLAPNADSTYSNAAGGMSVFAGLVLSKRGKPLSVLHLNKETYLDVLGAAIQPHEGFAFEPIRHVAQALNGGNGVVVRVVPKNMRIPVLRLVKTNSSSSATNGIISPANSSLVITPSVVAADNINAATITLTARDANGNLISGLHNAIAFSPSNSNGVTVGAIAEQATSGIYTATIRSNNSGNVNIRVTQNNNIVAGLAASVTFNPAIINAAHSSFTTSADSINADGTDSVIITLQARDNNNQPITGIAGQIDFGITGVTQTIVTQINEGAPGVYSAALTSRNAGTAHLTVQQNKNDVIGLKKDIEVKTIQTVVSRTPDPANSKLETNISSAEADGLTPVVITLTLKDANKQPITKAAGPLVLKISGVTNYDLFAISETPGIPGEYQAQLYCREPNIAVITAYFQGQQMLNLTSNVTFTTPTNLAPDSNRSSINIAVNPIVGDNKATTNVTFTALSGGGLPVDNLADVEFHLNNLKFTAVNNKDGTYSAVVKLSNATGVKQNYNISVWVNNVEFVGVSASLRVTSPSVVVVPDEKTTAFEPLQGAIVLSGNGAPASAQITLHLEDASGNAIPNEAANLEFVVTGYATVDAPLESTSGDYVATVTDSTEESVTVTVKYKGSVFGTVNMVLPFAHVDNVIDGKKSTFFATGTPAKADGTAEITLTVVAANAADSSLVGTVGLTFDVEGATPGSTVPAGIAQYITVGPAVEDVTTKGTFTAKVTSSVQGSYNIVAKQNGLAIANLAPVKADFTADASNADGYASQISSDWENGQPGDDIVISIYAYDKVGHPVTGITSLTLVDENNLANANISAFTEIGNGLYQAVVTIGQTAGDMNLMVQLSGTDFLDDVYTVTALEPDSAYDLDPSKSEIVFDQTSIEADGKTPANFTITLINQSGKAYTPRRPINLETTNHAGITISALTPDSAIVGKYTGNVISSTVGVLTLTVTEGGTSAGVKADYDFKQPAGTPVIPPVTSVAPDDAKSELTAAPANAKNDGTEEITVTFTAKKGNGQALSGIAADLGLQGAGAAGITATAFVETGTTGVYTLTLKSTLAGKLTLVATYKGAALTGAKETVEVEFTAPVIVPVYTAANSTLVISAPSIKADGTATATLTFTAKDQNSKPLTGATVVFVPSTMANVTLGTVQEVNGVYTATVKGTAYGSVDFTATVNGSDSGKPAVHLLFEVDVDPSKSTFVGGIATGNISAVNGDVVTLEFKLKDAAGADLADLKNEIVLDTGITELTLKTVTVGINSYVATLTSTKAGTVTPKFVRKTGGAEVITAGHTLTIVPAIKSATAKLTKTLSGNLLDDGTDQDIATLKLEPSTSSETISLAQISVVAKGADASKITSKVKAGANATEYTVSATSSDDGTYDLFVIYAGKELTTLTISVTVAATADEADNDVSSVMVGYVYRFNAPAPAAPPASSSGRAIATSTIKLEASTIAVGDEVQLGNDDILAIYVDDGDASGDRTVSITPHPNEADMWYITLNQVSLNGDTKVLERSVFTLTPDALDDMGLPSYLPVMLENSQSRLRAVVKKSAAFPLAYNGFSNEFFVGGSDGDLSTLTPDDYRDALNTLSSSMVNYTAVCSLGVYDPIVLQHLAQHSQDVRVDMFCDIRPAISGAMAPGEAAAQGLGSFSHVARYHFPYSSRDPLTSAQVVYGLSGDAFTAKAKGVAMTPDVGGWHYAPAGYTRAVLQRANVLPLAGAASIDREQYVISRINPVTVTSDGSIVIDDSLTTYPKNNYLRFQHVNSILNAIARGAYDVCQQMKHEPDGVTEAGLQKELPRLLDRFVASDALVRPRDASQGTEPFVVVIKQADFDLWDIKIYVCPTGVARRIAVEPILFR